MGFLNTVLYYVNMIGIVSILTLSVMLGVMYYFIKVRKITAKVENIDTSHFRKEDSIAYVPIKDVVSADGTLDSDGMIVINNQYFVGGLSVRGFDYRSASSEERIDTQINTVQFFNVVDKPTSFRQSVKKVDLSYNIEEHKAISKKIATELVELEAERQDTYAMAEQFVEEPEVHARYAERVRELNKIIFSKRHMLDEVGALINYMMHMSGDADNAESAIGQKTSQIMFSYKYNPDDFSTDLSKEEIYLKAMEGLNLTATGYAEALAACRFKARRLTARELIGLMRKHTSPLTGEDMNLDELLDSSYTALFVSSDSIVEACKEKIGEDMFMAQMEEYHKRLEEMLERQREEREKNGQALKEESYAIAEEELRTEMAGGGF